MNFSNLKAASGKSSLEKLTQELTKMSGPESKKDERFWYPNVDKAGNGYSVIRFLPAPANEDVPFVRIFEHGFKGPSGLWYIENSLTTLGNKSDPVSEMNSILWNVSSDDASPTRKQARDQKRKLNFIANIYVIQDTANPENNGKVFLFKFGKKVYDKLKESMTPQFADEQPLNPFDFWNGANFKLKIRNVEGYRNYDKSEFSAPSPLFDNDADMEALWKRQYSLQAFLDPSNFKSYDELKARLEKVLGLDDKEKLHKARAKETTIEDDEIPWTKPTALKAKETKTIIEDDEDEDMYYFKKLID